MTAVHRAGAGAAGNAEDGAAGATPSPSVTLSVWHIVGLALMIVGIIVVLLIVLPKFQAGHETATGVLGIVIPAFTTIGAALFGVTVGYSTGQSAGNATGTSAGRTAGEANKQQAVSAGRKQLAREIDDRAQIAQGSLTSIVGAIQTNMPSPAGAAAFRLAPGDQIAHPFAVSADDLAHATRGLAEIRRRAADVLAE